MSITWPEDIDFVDWSKQVALDYPQIGVIPTVHSESEWQEWALNVIGLPLISRFNPPGPHVFDDWKSWAEFFCEAITV